MASSRLEPKTGDFRGVEALESSGVVSTENSLVRQKSVRPVFLERLIGVGAEGVKPDDDEAEGRPGREAYLLKDESDACIGS